MRKLDKNLTEIVLIPKKSSLRASSVNMNFFHLRLVHKIFSFFEDFEMVDVVSSYKVNVPVTGSCPND